LDGLEQITRFLGHLSTDWERYVDGMVHRDILVQVETPLMHNVTLFMVVYSSDAAWLAAETEI
jgi:hypothetical protein